LPCAAYIVIATTDAFTHGWDLLAPPASRPTSIPTWRWRLLEGARFFIQPAFRGQDTKSPFGLEQPAPPSATNADALAAFLGRTA